MHCPWTWDWNIPGSWITNYLFKIVAFKSTLNYQMNVQSEMKAWPHADCHLHLPILESSEVPCHWGFVFQLILTYYNRHPNRLDPFRRILYCYLCLFNFIDNPSASFSCWIFAILFKVLTATSGEFCNFGKESHFSRFQLQKPFLMTWILKDAILEKDWSHVAMTDL